jgi:hypothetical protein
MQHFPGYLGLLVKERGAGMLLVTHSPIAAADRQLMLTPLRRADGTQLVLAPADVRRRRWHPPQS